MNYYERIQNSIDFIEDNLAEEITVEQCAKQAYMSVSGYYRMFLSVVGYTVKEYIRMRQHLLKRCIRHVPCRVNRNRHAFCAAALRQLRQEIRIQHALAAGEGHATACSIIIRLISAEDIQQ